MNLKEKLKEALKKAGLNEGLADIITIASESEIQGIVDQLKPSEETELDFNKILSSKDFTDYVAKNGFDKVLEASKTLQSAHDKKVTDGIKSFKDKYFKKIEGDEGDDDGGQKTKTKMADETPQWAKDLMTKVESLEKQEKNSGKSAQVKELMSKSKLSKTLQEKWLGRVNLESDTPFEEQIKNLESEQDELRSEIIGQTAGRGLPTGGQSNSKPSDQEIEDVVGNLM